MSEVKPMSDERLAEIRGDLGWYMTDADFAELLARLDARQAIVDKLPKAADGVAVVPLIDPVYSPSGREHTVRIDTMGVKPLFYVPEAINVDGDWRDLKISECYSTREAAIEASKTSV